MAFINTAKPSSESSVVEPCELNTYESDSAKNATDKESYGLNEYDIEVLTPEERLSQLIEEIENDTNDTTSSTEISRTTDSISCDKSLSRNLMQ